MNNVVYEYFHDRSHELTISKSVNGIIDPHFHRSLEVLYITKGAMSCKIGDVELLAEEDDVVFVHNYFQHAFTPSPYYEKRFIVVPYTYESDFDSALQQRTLPPVMGDKAFNREIIRPVFERLYDNNESLPPLVKKGYLNVIMGSLMDRYELLPLKKDSSISFLLNVLNYIDENYSKPLTLDSLSKKFGYNKYYFSRLFNSSVGENLNNYVNMVRVRQLTELARTEKNRSISELAYACGFESLSTFYRYFSRIHGETPAEYLGKRK